MKRRDAREKAFFIIFELSFKPDEDPGVLLEQAIKEQRLEPDEYLSGIVSGIAEHLSEIDAKIEAQAIGWKKNRISRVSLAVLRIAIYEISYVDEITDAIAINEAVELAKKYESEEAAAFVNGLLGALVRGQLAPEE